VHTGKRPRLDGAGWPLPHRAEPFMDLITMVEACSGNKTVIPFGDLLFLLKSKDGHFPLSPIVEPMEIFGIVIPVQQIDCCFA